MGNYLLRLLRRTSTISHGMIFLTAALCAEGFWLTEQAALASTTLAFGTPDASANHNSMSAQLMWL